MEIAAIFALVFSIFVGVGVHKADVNKEAVLKTQITELKYSSKLKPQKNKTIKIVENQNIEVINLGDA